MVKDPVCGMLVDENKAKYTSKAFNKIFYFCSVKCKEEFDRHPGKYYSMS